MFLFFIAHKHRGGFVCLTLSVEDLLVVGEVGRAKEMSISKELI